MIFIHGWNQSPSSKGSQIILNAYIVNGNYNILMLDWSDAASGIYANVQSRVDEVCYIHYTCFQFHFKKIH